jgi:acyl carrier protein
MEKQLLVEKLILLLMDCSAERISRDQIHPELAMAKLNLCSDDLDVFHMRLLEGFSLKFTDEEFSQVSTISDLAELMLKTKNREVPDRKQRTWVLFSPFLIVACLLVFSYWCLK